MVCRWCAMTVRVITTGGSIAEDFKDARVSHMTGDDLVQTVMRGSPFDIPVEVIDLIAVPSTWITPEDMFRVGTAVREACLDETITGVVVTHGTATMEETAYWVDLIIDGEKPVIFTGSQRYPGTEGYDGFRNIHDALLLASSPAARGLGAVVVIDGAIHAARDVTKVHPSSLAGFQSPLFGPLGRIDLGEVHIVRAILGEREIIVPHLPIPRVELLKCYAGLKGDVVEAVLSLGAQGLVIESMTAGGITPDMVGPVKAGVDAGIVVAVTTRCLEGRVMRRSSAEAGIEGYGYELQQLGVAMCDLQGLKARCRLMALLSSGLPTAEVLRRMDTAL
jgi:L-asparaginase